MKIIDLILAIICIIAAYYIFDLYSFNHCLSAVLLLLIAAKQLFKDKTLNKFINRISIILAIFLIIRVVIIG